MKNYQYIFFDWDGTLAKTLDIWLDALRASLEKRGYSLSDKEIGANFEIFKKRCESWGYGDAQAIIDEADDISNRTIPYVEMYPDSIATLRALKRLHKKLALITTSTHVYIDPLLRKHGLDTLFDVVVCGEDVEHLKPDPGSILKVLQVLQADPAQAVMIGDSEKDIQAATAAGIDMGLFYPPEHEKFYDIVLLQQLKPTFTIESFKELLLS